MSQEDGWQGFLELCVNAGSTKELDRLMELFLTIEEKKTLASRFLVVKALLEGKLSQREIAKTYKVSIAQITRGSNALKRIDNKLKKLINL
jgi:TrpR family transcriptional regulator, trp operon repressor